MFKRRRPKYLFENLREWVWPRRGWLRAVKYIWHRLVRINDGEHPIALALAFGAAASASPYLGTHFITAALLAWVFGGNIIASTIGTWVGNPFTFPFIWMMTFNTGSLLTGSDAESKDVSSFSFSAILDAPYDALQPIIVPMTLGSLPIGLFLGVMTYFPTYWLIGVYKEKFKKRRLLRQQRKQEKKAD